MFERFRIKEYTPKVGDIVEVSKINTNHLGYGVTAYAGFKGTIDEVYETNSFVIFSGHSVLVCPMQRRDKFYIILNGVERVVKAKKCSGS